VAGPESARNDFDGTRKALSVAGGAMFDVSAGYVAWAISGTPASGVLNRGCPLDLHPRAFPAGHCAQSVLGHINATFYKPDERSTLIVMVARSFAADAWRMLCASAESDGFRVGPAAAFAAVVAD
jgi:sarcosine oxidase subunit gamma